MTVKDLVAAIEKFGHDLPVVFSDSDWDLANYIDGEVVEVSDVRVVTVRKNTASGRLFVHRDGDRSDDCVLMKAVYVVGRLG